MNAIDTNVLVCFVDDHEPGKQAEATELLERLGAEETSIGGGVDSTVIGGHF